MNPIVFNIVYATISGILCVVAMMFAYFIFDWITPFDTAKQIDAKNTAVGLIIAGIFIGTGIAMGLVIGLSLN